MSKKRGIGKPVRRALKKEATRLRKAAKAAKTSTFKHPTQTRATIKLKESAKRREIRQRLKQPTFTAPAPSRTAEKK